MTYFEINQSVIQLLVLINVMSYAIVGLLTGWTQALSQQKGQSEN